MRIIIPTCEKYIDVLEAEKYTIDKFGGSDLDVTLLGFKKPTFDLGKWKFVSLGEDTGPQNLSHDLWKFFEDFEDEFFIYGNDDIVIVDELYQSDIYVPLLTEISHFIWSNLCVVLLEKFDTYWVAFVIDMFS